MTTGYSFDVIGNWRTQINQPIFKGRQDALRISNNNTGQGLNEINGPEFIGCKTAIELDVKSSTTTITDPNWDEPHTFLKVTEADKVNIHGGFGVGFDYTSDEVSPFELLGQTKVNLYGGIFVPGDSTGSKVAWFELRGGEVRCNGTHFGGEFGGWDIVNNYIEAETTSPVTPRGVQIFNCGVFPKDTIVRLFKIPNFVDIRGCTGNPTGTDTAIVFDPSLATLDSEITRAGVWAAFKIDNPDIRKINVVPDLPLLPFVYVNPQTSLGSQMQVGDGSNKECLVRGNRNLVEELKEDTGRVVKVKMAINNSASSIPYSEYMAKWDGSALQLEELSSTTSTYSPLLVDNAGVIEMTTNNTNVGRLDYVVERSYNVLEN